MQLFILLFIALCVAFALEEFVLIKPVSTIAQSDPVSRWIELLAIWVPAIGMSITGATVRAFGELWMQGLVNAIGVILCLAGLALRYWSRRVLGRFFTIGVVRQEGHRVVREGPYRHVRHPGYLAFVLFYAGLPLVVGSWLGLLVLAVPALSIFAVLVTVEDRKLEQELGADYTQYKAESARMIPGIW
ncbi:methyltransferase family protein [Caenimonas aquaedulcis]|uniref:Isoprenylcysteine carboxylmethyltransferase family protein n=1 Tax=Caenimonas aquaedulcis TaxID=2793270 RepID=A0A931H6S9_9BURK|nr:isoprenylcysteine carboxylmethyltransferase family protein [Caenimonas aquaedulcis]MBG9389430.1 isoprenylcysteine carboxylmethyltransferase family protein [Caenimonas aquaedulcis]